MVEDRVIPPLRVGGRNVRDITGASFDEWLVLAFVGVQGGKARWLARCGCGEVRVVAGNTLLTGASRSCGCVGDRAFAARLQRHGHARVSEGRSPTYRSWQSMMDRCYNPARRWYARYGGRGITVAARWHDFAAFLADMGERPQGTWLERSDNDKGYELGNCVWATPVQQQANKSTNVVVEYRGERRSLAEWARALNLSYQTLRSRLQAQRLSPSEAFERPGIGPFKGTSGRSAHYRH